MTLQKGQTTIWLTPRRILEALGPFDLDPCSAPSPRPWSTATNHIELPLDGLCEPWSGRVWLNPPYTGIEPWLKKMAQHRNGISFIFVRSDTKAWQKWVFPFAHSILFLEGRVPFHNQMGLVSRTGTAPSALIAYSEFDSFILKFSGLKGSLQKRA